MTRSASEASQLVTSRRLRREPGRSAPPARRSSPWSLAACARAGSARRLRGPAPRSPDAAARRSTPAQPGADPFSFLAWLFTPIFQVMFIILVAVYVVPREPRRPGGDRLGDRGADPARPGRWSSRSTAGSWSRSGGCSSSSRRSRRSSAATRATRSRPSRPSRSCSRSAASARSPAASRSCSRCRSCSSCTRSSERA